MSKKNMSILAGVGLALLLFYAFSDSNDEESAEVTVEVERGLFEVIVFTTGELEAKNSVDIKGPAGLRSAGIWRVRITDLIPEGTRVKKGDYIAALDKSELSDKISNAASNLSKSESQYTQTKLDTTLDLRAVREEIINLEYDLQEKQITLKQSQYEPPALIRQAEINLEKAVRALSERKESYTIKIKKSQAKMQEAAANLGKDTRQHEMLTKLAEGFNIMAPEDGMVIYEREWNGKKKTTGSEVGAWDPTVATLPDLSKMISKTYVNEVDIRKVRVDQQVNISLDAFPDKKLTGVIIEVANVGENLPNTDSKVFEVRIEMNEMDSTIRPGMTTGNNIIASSVEDVLFIPLEAVHSQEDTLVYVYKKSGWRLSKQEIRIGKRNENFVIVTSGLEEGEDVLLSTPEDRTDMTVELLAENPE
ncbi:MAG TPA: HlyD family efflux transporter periplasmic adaptor subunit [Flavobacteriales bacterium]|nr:HlyD family efflux transporter periplasmic adaptor subunit [Flavobacteriales bacterium]HIO68479.1 HlyD family efflux transporter periplasmic adaptor subunit [Flavobacteriales bacterium]